MPRLSVLEVVQFHGDKDAAIQEFPRLADVCEDEPDSWPSGWWLIPMIPVGLACWGVAGLAVYAVYHLVVRCLEVMK